MYSSPSDMSGCTSRPTRPWSNDNHQLVQVNTFQKYVLSIEVLCISAINCFTSWNRTKARQSKITLSKSLLQIMNRNPFTVNTPLNSDSHNLFLCRVCAYYFFYLYYCFVSVLIILALMIPLAMVLYHFESLMLQGLALSAKQIFFQLQRLLMLEVYSSDVPRFYIVERIRSVILGIKSFIIEYIVTQILMNNAGIICLCK